MPLDQWQALAGLHSGEAHNNITVSFLPIGVAIASGAQGESEEKGGSRGGEWKQESGLN